MNQILLAFLTGLTTGGISCFAVQGGLLTTSIANQSSNSQKISIAYFLSARFVSYALLGALLGFLGSSIAITPKMQGTLQILAGLLMLATVGKLLDIHPIFRKFTLTVPKSFFRLLRIKSRENNVLSPAILGFLTVLIPCGITQSMMLLSVSTGNPLTGSLILGGFILGTSPVFAGLGFAAFELLRRKSLRFVAASAIFILAVMSINTGQVLRGSVHTLQNYWKAATSNTAGGSPQYELAPVNSDGVQEVEIKVLSRGYSTNVKTLKANQPVNLKLVTQNTKGCVRAFTIPEYNISRILPESGIEEVSFTPNKEGRLTFTCSMGMYTGYFDVI